MAVQKVVGTLDCRISAQRAQNAQSGHMIPTVAHSLRARHDGGEDGTGRGTPLVPSWPAEVAPTLNAAFGTKQGLEDQHALGGAGCFVPALPITFHNRQDPDASGDITHPLGAKDNGLGVAMAFCENHRAEVRLNNAVGAITAGGGKPGQGYPAVLAPTLTATNDPSRSPQSSEITAQVAAVTATTLQVRRLTPIECERLQGFPDGYTDIRPRGKDTPDGPRYKALGNSMAVPVMRWIGERIEAVDKLSR